MRKYDTKEDGPCPCGCHDHRPILHCRPCCAYMYQPRADAEAAAQKARENSTAIADNDDAWEPDGPLGHDGRFVGVVGPEEEREADKALPLRIRLRRWWKRWWERWVGEGI